MSWLSGPNAAVIEAEHGVITNDPRQIVLDHPHLKREDRNLQADQATFYLDCAESGRAVAGHRKRHDRDAAEPHEKPFPQSPRTLNPNERHRNYTAAPTRPNFYSRKNEDVLRTARH